MDDIVPDFSWNSYKEVQNTRKHGVDFYTAAQAFTDLQRKIYIDEKHSTNEPRYFCIGKVKDKIITVRFTYREKSIRIYGAGYWRQGRRYYEEKDR